MLRCPADAGVVAHRSRGPRQTRTLLPAATSMTTNGYFFPNGMVSSAASGTAALLLTRDGAPPVRWDPEAGQGSGVTLTYSFLDAVPADYARHRAAEYAGFLPFNE